MARTPVEGQSAVIFCCDNFCFAIYSIFYFPTKAATLYIAATACVGDDSRRSSFVVFAESRKAELVVAGDFAHFLCICIPHYRYNFFPISLYYFANKPCTVYFVALNISFFTNLYLANCAERELAYGWTSEAGSVLGCDYDKDG